MVPNTYQNTTIHLDCTPVIIPHFHRSAKFWEESFSGITTFHGWIHHHHFDNKAGSRDHAPNIRTWDHFDVFFFPSLQYFRSSFHMALT